MTVEDCAEAIEWSLDCLCQGLSFKAIDSSNGKIIGIIMNELWEKSVVDRQSNAVAETLQNEKLKIILTFCEHIESQVKLFDLYPQYERAMYINKLSVDTAYRNLGIARKLIETTFQLMTDMQLDICQILVTNYYLVKLCLKLNFQIVHETEFENYVVNGVRPLLPAEPHNAAKILIKIFEK